MSIQRAVPWMPWHSAFWRQVQRKFISLQYAPEGRESPEKTLFIGRKLCYNKLIAVKQYSCIKCEIRTIYQEFPDKKAYEELFMVNEEKVKVMNRLAMYEHGEGRKYLPVSRYYRSDYIGLALIKNFFLVTIGYVLLLAGIAAYFSEYLMDNVNKINLVAVGIYIIGGYLGMLIVYSVLTYIQYSVKYHRAKKSVKEYYQDLTRLEKIYGRGEKRTPVRRKSGGHRK